MRDMAHTHLAFILRDAALLEKRNKEAQTRLKNAGSGPGPIDGVIGPKTEAAIRAFQIKHRLPATETLDEETLNTLGAAPIYPLLRKPQQPLTDRVS
jgi:hypothetical protein